MTQIALKIETTYVVLDQDISYNEIRLIATTVFVHKNRKSWSKDYDAIVDTGAPLTVVPHSIWRNLHVKICRPAWPGGIHPGESCKILCSVGMILLKLADNLGKQSKVFVCRAYLLPKNFDSVPLVLGYNTCLERFKLVANPRKDEAYLEM